MSCDAFKNGFVIYREDKEYAYLKSWVETQRFYTDIEYRYFYSDGLTIGEIIDIKGNELKAKIFKQYQYRFGEIIRFSI